MQHWSQLATRNWRARPVRTLGAVAAIALGTGAVVWVTCSFESVRSSVLSWANQYVGRSHVNIESPLGRDGTVSELLLKDIEPLEGVKHVTPLLMRRLSGEAMTVQKAAQSALQPRPWDRYIPKFDFYGIDMAREDAVRDWDIVAGRPLRPDDAFACILEAAAAEEESVGVDDVVRVWGAARSEPFELKIVGLVERRRIARFQKGLVLLPLRTLQQIDLQNGRLTAIDIVAADDSRKGVRQLRTSIISTLQRRPFGRNTNVSDTIARMRQIEMAQSQQELVLVMLSSVAMLTALFIILSTLSMGMIERISQLGLMRCIGVTGRQLAALVAIEVAPLGVIGVLAGIPIGLGLAVFSVWLVPEYVGSFQVSWRGLALAVVSGLTTTAVAAVLPMLAALRVSPLEAAHPQARRPRRVWLWVALAFAALLLVAQIYILETRVVRSPEFRNWAAAIVVLLYLSYACAAPLIVWLVGSPAVWVAARLLGVRSRLLQDQVGHAVWRSTGICCGLMVGLSLIVGLVVFSESFQSGWQFPKQFPEAYLWSIDQMREQTDDVDDVLAEIDGVRSWAGCNAANVYVTERPNIFAQLYAALTWFVGCDPEEFFKVVRVEFVEGDQATALELLNKGGYVVIADDFSRSRNKHMGDEVTVYFANRRFTFKVAAVVTSPALDIAAGYFQMHSQMQVAASGSVIGTNEDMKRLFGIRGRRLLLMNLELPPEPVPQDWPPPANSAESVGLPEIYYDTRMTLERRWERYRETQMLAHIADILDTPDANYGTVAELKDEIDRQLMTVTRLLTAVPAVALIVAALGVANLMTANVTSRAKQLAILRAVGATRGLVLRLVIGEAVVLGLLGSALGIGLGLHLASNTTLLTERMWGFMVQLQMPWGFVLLAMVLTVGLCIIAGILPARSAARTNVVDALHVN